jgi:hypothetical protein
MSALTGRTDEQDHDEWDALHRHCATGIGEIGGES